MGKRLLYWLSGPRLPLLNLVAAEITCTVVLWQHAWVFYWGTMYRELEIISRVSMVWFIPTFVARPLNDVFHHRITRWMVKNRRYLGLSFAAWFLQHLWILPVIGIRIFKTFWNAGQLVFPGTTLLLCVILCLTSFDRCRRSMPGWRTLHWLGLQALWLWFLANYLKLGGRHQPPKLTETGDLIGGRPQGHEIIYASLLIAAQALRVGVAIWKQLGRRAEAKADG